MSQDFIPDEQFMPDASPVSAEPSAPAPQASMPEAPKAASPDFIPEDQFLSDEDKYGSTGQMLKTAAEGAAQGLVGPLAPIAETKLLGVAPEDIRNRAEINPTIHYASEIAGLTLPAIVSGGESVAAKAGLEGLAAQIPKLTQINAVEKVASLLPAAGDTLASKIGSAAAKGFVENALIAGSDETSRMILQDPSQSAESAIATIGLAGVLGGGLNAGGALFSATAGKKLGQLVADFKGALADHVNNPDPVSAVTGELNTFFKEITKVGSETYGDAGIKSQAINKWLPELHDGMLNQVSEISEKLQGAIDKLGERGDPNASLLEDKLSQFRQDVNTMEPSKIFDGIQSLKQSLQADSKYTEGLSPLAERPYRNAVKDLAHDFREALEDKAVWGKAADIQSSINSAFSDYLKATKDFRGLMTTNVMGVPEVNPGKVNTFLNQLGKPNAEIKADKLHNFIAAGEQLKEAVNSAYDKLGIESPILDTPLNNTKAALEDKTLGKKMADAFLNKALHGANAGGAVGGLLGSMVGHGGLGYIVGAHALGPFFQSILPAIAKAFVTKDVSAPGAKAAIDYGMYVFKASELLDKATSNVFKVESPVLASSLIPSDRDRVKIQKALMAAQADPQSLMQADDVSKYLPEHSQALAQTTAMAMTYLNGLKGDQTKKLPLDSTPVLSAAQKSSFYNALNIAQQPMVVLDKIKKGTITFDDVKHLNAMYPSLAMKMRQKLTDAMINELNRGKSIPYKTRLGLSLFTGQSLDSTMTPQALAATQMQSGIRQAAQMQQQQIRSSGVKSAPALQKMPGMYATSGNSREQRRNKI